MRQILQIFFVLLFAVGFSQTPPSGWQILPFTVSGGDCDDLSGGNGEIFISEVYDAQTTSYGITELFNPTTNPINLSGYSIIVYNLPGTNSTQLNLYGIINPGQSMLIQHGSGATCTTISPPITGGQGFNANDKIELWKNGILIDVFLEFNNVLGYTYIRRPNAIVPNINHSPADWLFTDRGNDSTGCNTLGPHTIDPTTPPEIKYITRQPDGALPYTYCDVPTRVRVQMDASITGYVYRYNLSGTTTGYNVTNNTTGLFSNLFEDTYVMTVSVRRSTATNVEICTIEATFTISGGIQTSPIILLNP